MTNDDAPAFSVVVPCFDGAAYLAEALDSILAQRQAGLEIVFVDDGSRDGSVAIAAHYAPTVRVLRQANAGIAAARNAGVAAARGKFLAFLDADDVWPAGSLAARHAALLALPPRACVFGSLEQFHSDELAAPTRHQLQAHGDGPAAARFAGTMLVRRADFLAVGGFDASLKVGEMIEWVARAEASGLLLHGIATLTLRRRLHGANTTLRHAAELQHAYLRALKVGLDRRRAGAKG